VNRVADAGVEAGGDEAARLREQVASMAPWFHNLHLPHGVHTAPDQPYGDFPAFKRAQIAPHVPADLSGWTVLDIGCNAGFYTFELARRGARVTALDVEPHYLRQARWAARELGLEDRVDFREGQIYDLARSAESYDLVWFMGVLYHLRHPLLALDLVRRRTRRLLVMQTMSMPGAPPVEVPPDLRMVERDRLCGPGWPRMAFIERRLAGDPSNWWAADAACIEAMLRSSGFRVRGLIADETYLCEPARIADPDMSRLVDVELRAATGCDTFGEAP